MIVERLGPKKIVLYGSLALGIFRAARSDVDLAVEGLGIEAPPDLAKALLAAEQLGEAGEAPGPWAPARRQRSL